MRLDAIISATKQDENIWPRVASQKEASFTHHTHSHHTAERLRFEFGTENTIKTTVCRAHRRIVAPGVPSVCCVRVQGMGQRIP